VRTVNYDADCRERWTRYAHRLADLESSFPARLPRQRPRAPLKEKLLLELDLARRDRLLACRELIRLGPRHWRWRIAQLESLGE
jgi:hypothetical protein